MGRIQIVQSFLSLKNNFGFNPRSQGKFLKNLKHKNIKILFINLKGHCVCHVENGFEWVEKEGSQSVSGEIS